MSGESPLQMNQDGDQNVIEALTREEALSMRLPPHSRFRSYELAQQVADHPDLAYRVRGAVEYIVGGYWRRRPEIVTVLEMASEKRREALLRALASACRSRGNRLIVLDPREQERNLLFYRGQGFTVVQTVVQYDRRGLHVDGPQSSIAIRAMEVQDIEPVLDVERHSFPWLWWNSAAEFLWYASVPGVELYVALATDKPQCVVGYVGFTIWDREAHLDRLAVTEDYQKLGYGAALLVFAMRRMHALGARRVALTTQVDNRRSQALYKRFGFRDSGWQHDIYGLWLGPPPEGEQRP